MLQQINLCKPYEIKKIVLPFRQIISLNILLMIILSLIATMKSVNYYANLKKIKQLSDTQAKLNKSLNVAKQKVLTESQKQNLSSKVKLLQQEVEFNQKMYKTLTELNEQKTIGLSKYLVAIANTEVRDLWLTSFKFSNSDPSIYFEGVSANNSSILQYLEDLSKNNIFQQKTFSNLQIFFDDKTKQIKFIVGS